MTNQPSDGCEERSIEDLRDTQEVSDEESREIEERLRRYALLLLDIAKRIKDDPADDRRFNIAVMQAEADRLAGLDAQTEIFHLKRGHKR